MAYWLLKSEPGTFSIQDLQNSPAQTTAWDGVRNYQARNYIKSMQKGDQAFFYHSSCAVPGIAGIVTISSEAYPEKNQPDSHRNIWFSIDITLTRTFSFIIALTALRKQPTLTDMLILRKGNRLSVTPIQPQEWKNIFQLLT